MIRNLEGNNFKMNVYLKSGEVFCGADITANPFEDHGRVVSFWYNNYLRFYPLEDIKFCEIYEEDNNKKYI